MLGRLIEPRSNKVSSVRKRLFGIPAQRFEMREYWQYSSGFFGQERFQSAPGGYRAIYGDQGDFDRAVRVVLDRVLFDAEVVSHKTTRNFDRRHELIPADDLDHVLQRLVKSRRLFQIVIFAVEPLPRYMNVSL